MHPGNRRFCAIPELSPSDANAQTPQQTLLRLLAGAWAAQAIHAVARLGVADLLAEGPRSCTELAEATGTHAPSLYRLLRVLAGLGVFAEVADGRFRLTSLGEPLRADVTGSVRGYAVLMGEPMVWRSWGGILHSLRTGEPAFDQLFGTPLFDYLAGHPEEARVFDEAMTGRSAVEIAAVLAAYDFSGAGTVVDVGGGRGTLLAAILKANPQTRGVLFDRPQAVEAARFSLVAAGLVPGRCDLSGGDFFDAVPAGGGLYVLKRIIHDWDDARARSILRNCRATMPETGRLLLVELVIPPDEGLSDAKMFDLLMLVFTGGRERTAADYRDLLASAGFDLVRIIPTASNVSIIEAVPR